MITAKKDILAQKYGRQVQFFIDSEQNIYAIPYGLDKTKTPGIVRYTAATDIVLTLFLPYSNEELEEFILKAFNTCYEKDYEPGPTALEKYFDKKNWLQAIKGLRHIFMYWTKEDGYFLVPMERDGRRGYTALKTYEIGANPPKGVIAKIFEDKVTVLSS